MPKGYQICDCGFLVPGPRTMVCPDCKGPTPRAKKGQSEPIPMDTFEVENARTVNLYPDGYNYPDRFSVIHAAAGSCPVSLRAIPGEDGLEETLQRWAGDVRQTMLDRGKYLTNNALVQWARNQLNGDLKYSPIGEEMEYVGLIIGGMPDIETREITT